MFEPGARDQQQNENDNEPLFRPNQEEEIFHRGT
jgi:hypothetical protein